MLWPSTKVTGLFFDNRIRMAQERRIALLSFLTHAADTSPDLRLHVRRDHLIRDAVDSVRAYYSYSIVYMYSYCTIFDTCTCKLTYSYLNLHHVLTYIAFQLLQAYFWSLFLDVLVVTVKEIHTTIQVLYSNNT